MPASLGCSGKGCVHGGGEEEESGGRVEYLYIHYTLQQHTSAARAWLWLLCAARLCRRKGGGGA